MKKFMLAGAVCICFFTSMIAANKTKNLVSENAANTSVSATNVAAANYWIDSLYANMGLSEAGLSKQVFFNACKGYEYLLSQNVIKKAGLITICDYSQCSNKKRLYVLNLDEGKIMFNTYVSHGRNSGSDYATSFSNSNDSHKSSLGFMVTAETYNGENGYSMRLDGMENGFNNNVRMRSIVMHGSDYVCPQRALKGTMMGRSYGCPAVPAGQVKQIVNYIKDGSCFFNFYPDRSYTTNSKILNADFVWPVAQSLLLASVKIPDSLMDNQFPPISIN